MTIYEPVDNYNPNGDKKGNFLPRQVVNTFKRIIAQYKPNKEIKK